MTYELRNIIIFFSMGYIIENNQAQAKAENITQKLSL
jgi:hypothetical protein